MQNNNKKQSSFLSRDAETLQAALDLLADIDRVKLSLTSKTKELVHDFHHEAKIAEDSMSRAEKVLVKDEQTGVGRLLKLAKKYKHSK